MVTGLASKEKPCAATKNKPMYHLICGSGSNHKPRPTDRYPRKIHGPGQLRLFVQHRGKFTVQGNNGNVML